MPRPTARQPASALRDFLNSEAAGGTILMLVAALALVVSNSPAASLYFTALEAHVGGLSVLHWINDGLMVVFFLLVGLEIKREFVEGELATRSQAVLPAVAALGGMAVPALIYAFVNAGDAVALRGWAIPAATDISVGVHQKQGVDVQPWLSVATPDQTFLYPVTDHGSEVLSIINPAIDQIFLGNDDIAPILKDANDKIKALY